MGKIYYNKLVRDRIPEIIRMSGKECVTSILPEDEYSQGLREKLREEVQEYLESHAPEELADILEVVHALVTLHGLDVESIEQIRREKRNRAGGFQDRIQLISVEEHDKDDGK